MSVLPLQSMQHASLNLCLHDGNENLICLFTSMAVMHPLHTESHDISNTAQHV